MTVFAPASVTCIFSPRIGEKPENSGSVGVGFTINRGVVAKVSDRCDGDREVVVNGRKVSFPTVEYVLSKLNMGRAVVSSSLPFACGFGLSGASAIATSMHATFSGRIPFMNAADVAHEAEVVNLTGLGDVVTQTFGGVVVRRNASCPSKAVITRLSWKLDVDFVIMGELSTKDVIGDDLRRDRIAESGKRWMKEFLRNPRVEKLFECSKKFAEETGLLECVDSVADAIEAVESGGGMAAMVMLGKAVFAVNGFEQLAEFGDPFRASIDCCGVRKIEEKPINGEVKT